ncbi:hypothetical protein PSMK_04270 [Phycisphaera mikurensis NBRC 102666]|uniref:Uncharacterized protein n=1 Tax=Phycisphaera mikurensis (strain NBRC 102666 / KCTC 22515 / FYK2301M01) TaxID=1142394 RepID=I0IBE8_PHYMF|nr:hypothetical protein PSMK_04270 [Phycisphaera mikurensis NBRC 102666]
MAALLGRVFGGGHWSDEYRWAQDLFASDRLSETAFYGVGHFGAEVLMFAYSRLPGVGSVESYRLLAVAIAFLAAIGAAWTAVREGLLRPGFAPAALLVFASNAAWLYWGGFGWFNYALMLAASVVAWALMLRWRRRGFAESPRTLVLTAALMVAMLFAYLGSALPLAAAGAVALAAGCLRGRDAGPVSVPRVRWAPAAALAAVLLVTIGVVLARFTHGELADPRPAVWPWLYPRSVEAEAGGATGAVHFLADRGWNWLWTALEPVSLRDLLDRRAADAAAWWITSAMLLLLGIGCVDGLARGGARRATVLFVLLQAAVLAAASLLGRLPFGYVRYALFTQGPLLIVAICGLESATRAALAAARRGGLGAPRGVPGAASLGLVAAAAAVGFAASAPAFVRGVGFRACMEEMDALVAATDGLPTLGGVVERDRLRYLHQRAGRPGEAPPLLWRFSGDWIDDPLATSTPAEALARVRAGGGGGPLRTVTMRPWEKRGGRGYPGEDQVDAVLAWLREEYDVTRSLSCTELILEVWEPKPKPRQDPPRSASGPASRSSVQPLGPASRESDVGIPSRRLMAPPTRRARM